MAITFTTLDQGVVTAVSNFTTASLTFASGREYFITISNSEAAGPTATPTLSGWTNVGPSGAHFELSTNSRGTILRRSGDGTSGTKTPGFGTNEDEIEWSVIEVSGCAAGASMVVQSTFVAANDSGAASLTLTLASFTDATNNAVYTMFYGINLTGDTGTKEAAYTALASQANGNNRFKDAYFVGEDTAVKWTHDGFKNRIAIALEISVSGGGAATGITSRHVSDVIGGAIAGSGGGMASN